MEESVGGLAREGGAAGTLSVDEAFSRIDIGFFHYRLLLTCGFGFSAAAVEVVLTGFLFDELRTEWNLDEYSLGVIPSIVGFGSILGELFWGVVADHYGRRWVFMATVVIVVIFGLASAFSGNLTTLYILRFFVGFGYGGNIAIDFAMFIELLPTSERGRMLFYMAAFWPVGQVSTCAIAWLVIPTFGWRGFLVVCALPSLLTTFLRPLIPESPRWLLLRGQDEEALEVCRGIALCNGVKPEDVGLGEGVKLSLENEATCLMVANGQEEEHAAGKGRGGGFCEEQGSLPSFFGLFSRPLRRTTAALMILVAGLGFGGYATTTFMPSFLQMRGITLGNIYQIMFVSSAAQFPGVIFAGIASTIIGRKLPLQFALVAVTVALAFFSQARTVALVTVSTCFASAFLEFGWALFHVYTPEAFPTELRATAIGFISAFGSICSMSAPFVCAYLLEQQASATKVAIHFCAWVGGCSLLSAFLFHLETKDRDLTDVALQVDRPIEEKGDSINMEDRSSSSHAA